MIFNQQQLFDHEAKTLAPYAIRSSQSRGRKYKELEDPYRTPFQRDRDRIIHSKAFRRLRGKTQVFTTSYGDHYRSRLSHSIEVAQVSRDIARTLGLNEDICEVVALAHDLGHTPFGHAGEEAMQQLMAKFDDTFEHNQQSLRIVEVLEKKSPDHPGLNLTFEVLDGLKKHDPIVHSLEAQVVNIADAIAYHHHDLDDGLRAKLISYDQLEGELEIWKISIDELDFKKIGESLYRQIAVNRVISLMITDLVENSNRQLVEQRIGAPLSRLEQNGLISFSSRMQGRVDSLAEFLGQHFYLQPDVLRQARQGQKIIKNLFQSYSEHEELLPERARKHLEHEKHHIVIKDYIAGMTDEYARKKHAEALAIST
ncbi:MAG: dNTP triphosphohydrolase [bacterium]|nr:dNTP triphosphohydrolase [bacterium]